METLIFFWIYSTHFLQCLILQVMGQLLLCCSMMDAPLPTVPFIHPWKMYEGLLLGGGLENEVDSSGIAGHLFFTRAMAATAAMAAQTIMPWHCRLAQSLALGRWRWQQRWRWWQHRRQCRGIASLLACSRGGGGSSADDGATALPAVCLLSCLLACAVVAVAETVQTTMPWHHQLYRCLGITSLLACSLARATTATAVAAAHMMMP
jgi:hypothetical protein